MRSFWHSLAGKASHAMTGKPTSSSTPIIVGSEHSAAPTVAGLEGNYRVIRLLGRGTMASVYLAEQVSMARPVALKILSPSLSGDPAFIERFTREARASARLNHPNIVSAIDFGEYESRFFLAMEFVDGEPLSSLLAREGALEEGRVIGIGLQVISALEHAVQHQVIHLDVKPANIMIRKDGRVKLTDFGLAMIMDTPGGVDAGRKAAGTPYYMAPEQVEGGKLDWRTDQYSLGASLYEAVTGEKPFQGNSVSDILVKRFFEKPQPAWRAGRRKASRSFSAILAKMLSRSPDGRYQSFVELEEDFNLVKLGKKPAMAKVASSAALSAPSSSAWDALGYTDIIGRVDGMLWRLRWNWIIYSSLLFLCLLGLYAFIHGAEIMGPVPPRMVDSGLIAQARNLPVNLDAETRESWVGAMQLVMRAEKSRTPVNLRRAIYSLRLLTRNRELKDTVYANEAQNLIDILESRLDMLEGGEERGNGKDGPGK